MSTGTASEAVTRLVEEAHAGRLNLPFPGSGRTADRWDQLRKWGAGDLSFAKLAESHTDALAILDEARRVPVPGAAYGVWASASGGSGLHAAQGSEGFWVLKGRLRFASAAGHLDRALVAAQSDVGSLMFDVDVRSPAWRLVPGSWPTVGMAGTQSVDVMVDECQTTSDSMVGEPGWYTARPGFWIGAVGVAAVWIGALDAFVDTFTKVLRRRAGDVHQLAHLGAMTAAHQAVRALLDQTAHGVDSHPDQSWQMRALEIRCLTESLIDDAITRLGRATGPGLIVRDADHARRVADISVFVRQSHAERDLAELGRLVVSAGDNS